MSLTIYLVLGLVLANIGLSIFRHISSPLRKIPAAHWSCRFSGLFMLYKRYTHRENVTIFSAHRKHGPIVLLSPTELSVNDLAGLRTIYSGGWEKHSWYSLFRNVEDTPNMFSTLDGPSHTRQKRLVSGVYARSNLLSSPEMEAVESEVVNGDLLNTLGDAAKQSKSVRIGNVLSRMGMDSMTAFAFGRGGSSRFMHDNAGWEKYMRPYGDTFGWAFWQQELPSLEGLARWIMSSSRHGMTWTDEWCMRMCEEAEEKQRKGEVVNGEAVVWTALQKGVGNKEADVYQRRKVVASELLDHFLAGWETTSIVLTYCLYHLSLNPEVRDALQKELRNLETPFSAGQSKPTPSLKSLDNLPLLSAVINETLRLNSPVSGPQVRVSPQGASLLGFTLPGGLRVSSSALCLHRNETIYPNADKWVPGRWMKDDDDAESEHLKDMHRWFWAFGSGGRMCVGSNFALLHMKATIAAICANFNTEIIDDSGIEQKDGFTTGPKKDLVLRFVAI